MSKPEAQQQHAMTDAEVDRQMSRLTRRGFATGGIAALAGAAGLGWVVTAEREEGLPWPLRRMLQWNERVSHTVLGEQKLAPTFPADWADEPRPNGKYGLAGAIDEAAWRLRVLGPPERTIELAAIRALPRVEMVTELKCIEGWSQVVAWAGARLADFANQQKLSGDYVSLMTPDKKYYVGLDIASALHPQTLLCYEMNGRPLTPAHGAPLRLVSTVKYGIKSIKRIGSIEFTNTRPADYWAEKGYDWHAGL